VAELARTGSTELVWDVRASSHTSAWFHRIRGVERFPSFMWRGPEESGWTRQCCRQADVILLAARAEGACSPWPELHIGHREQRGARIELALLHDGNSRPAGGPPRAGSRPRRRHRIITCRLVGSRQNRPFLTRRGVGLVLSAAAARGFAHLGIMGTGARQRIPSTSSRRSASAESSRPAWPWAWSDDEMRRGTGRSFV